MGNDSNINVERAEEFGWFQLQLQMTFHVALEALPARVGEITDESGKAGNREKYRCESGKDGTKQVRTPHCGIPPSLRKR
jgi:hypothetical protein